MKKILPIIIFIAISIGTLSYKTAAYAAVSEQEKAWAIEARDSANQASQSGTTALGEFGATNDAYFQILSANDAGKLTNPLSQADLADLLSKKNYTYSKSQAAKNAAVSASGYADCAEAQAGWGKLLGSFSGCGKDIEGDKIAAAQYAKNAAKEALDINTYSDYMVNFLKSHLKNPADYTDANTTNIDNSRIAASNAPVLQECFTGYHVNPGVCLREGFGWFLYMILSLMAALAKFGGYLLDYAIRYTVLDMSKNIHDLSSIDVMWKIFRDLCNLSFIFILLYVAVQTILQINNANPLRILRQIVIAAILINFSLFIAKLIIDFSNIFTLAFYNQMIGKTGTMSGAIMNLFGIQSLWGDKMSVVQTWSQSWSTLFSMTIGSIVITFTAAFSFLAAAWLFSLRYFILILVFMLAPIGFMGTVLPQVKSISKRWFDALIGQALFPPIYMLLMWVTLRVGQNISGLKGDFGTALSLSQRVNLPSGTGILNPVFRFMILVVLMNFALILAKTQAGRVGGRVQKIMEGGLKRVDGIRSGIKGRAQGVGGYVLREGIPLGGKDRKGVGIGKYRLKTLGGFGAYAQKKDKELGSISGDTVTGKLIGNTRVGNWVRAATLGNIAESKFGTGKIAKQYKDEGGKIAGKQKEINDTAYIEHYATSPSTKLPSPAPQGMEEALDRISNSQLAKIKTDILAKEGVIQHLDNSQFNALMNASAEDKTDSDKAKLKTVRNQLIIDAIGAPGAKPGSTPNPSRAQKLIGNMSGSEIKRLPISVITRPEFVKYLTPSKLSQMDDLPSADRLAIGAAIISLHNPTATPPTKHAAYGYINDATRAGLWI